MNPKIYTGNGNANNAITGVGFQPNWVWIKKRSGADAHYIFDSVRGVDKQIQSNSTAAEYDYSGDTHRTLTAFGSDGFTLQTSDGVNHNNQTFASWNWKAGTSVSGNSGGSGTAKSYTGSVSTASGFSIIKYIGNGSSGHTIPHHLGAIPQWVVIKELPNASDWMGYHQVLGNTKTIKLNEPDTPVTGSGYWNNTTPTSSVVTLGSSGEINQNDTNYVMYAFSEKQGYSKFNSYTGNSNADGTFIYTGFKPAFFMAKASGRSENWYIFDNKRLGYNVDNNQLYADTTSTESTTDYIDILANGIKFRYNSVGLNGSGENYIYMAFAENPFVASNFNAATAR
jgi:hypothetical protein|tara:strand:- start:9 stop:1028 length:1020 start_codon:yes stop_codon:yes gene_type:complete